MNVSSLFIHPLKSARAISLDRVMVTPMGLNADRRVMLVDPDGHFITQREMPVLAQITALPQASMLVLEKDGEAPLMVAPPDPSNRVDVTIWSAEMSAACAADSVNARLSGWLGRPVRLVFMDHLSERTANPAWAGPGTPVAFTDGYQVLVATTGGLAELNRILSEQGHAPVGMERFRPNIVIDCDEPFGEDFWATIRIGDVTLDLVKPCTRCVVVTQDQKTGSRDGPDPMPALRHARLSEDKRETGVMYGWNAVPRSDGLVSIGDTVEVLARRPEGWAFWQR